MAIPSSNYELSDYEYEQKYYEEYNQRMIREETEQYKEYIAIKRQVEEDHKKKMTVDDNTKKLLEAVTDKINNSNAKLGVNTTISPDELTKAYTSITSSGNTVSMNTIYPNNTLNIYPNNTLNYGSVYQNVPITPGITSWPNIITWGANQVPDDTTEPITPSPKIDMDNPIYKNEFEEQRTVEIGKDVPSIHPLDKYSKPVPACAAIGLIDEVSEDEDDLYAKLPDGEIVPFSGHQEKITVEIDTWNDLRRSDLIGTEIKKAATCKIYIDGHLARIIEGVSAQDLLMKADRAIEELKVQPFSICRDRNTLVGRQIYWNSQPAVIVAVDEYNNFIYITPDYDIIKNFQPPVSAIEEGESEEWIAKFGKGMMIRDHDEKIWWWRNDKTGNGSDLADDPFYGQFPQPVEAKLLPAPAMVNFPPFDPNQITRQHIVNTYTSPYTTSFTITPIDPQPPIQFQWRYDNDGTIIRLENNIDTIAEPAISSDSIGNTDSLNNKAYKISNTDSLNNKAYKFNKFNKFKKTTKNPKDFVPPMNDLLGEIPDKDEE